MFSRDAKNPVFIGFFNFLFFACLEDVECEIVLFQGFSTFSTGFSTVLHIQNESYKMFKQGFPQNLWKTIVIFAFFCVLTYRIFFMTSARRIARRGISGRRARFHRSRVFLNHILQQKHKYFNTYSG